MKNNTVIKINTNSSSAVIAIGMLMKIFENMSDAEIRKITLNKNGEYDMIIEQVTDVLSNGFEKHKHTSEEFDSEKIDDFVDKAKTRMESFGYSESQLDYIFSDWADWNNHIKWLLTASKKEVDDWGESANWGELEDDEEDYDFDNQK